MNRHYIVFAKYEEKDFLDVFQLQCISMLMRKSIMILNTSLSSHT